jgi:hypothetical protein
MRACARTCVRAAENSFQKIFAVDAGSFVTVSPLRMLPFDAARTTGELESVQKESSFDYS